ncbi:hypothetical protein ACFVZ3_06545 [Kitasatospora purpeofusca]|uniref:hypothetical protein n=1 Tax=Kitasatospora purpeofusca TaxID=67352 RepID=UPI0036C3FD94
MTVVVREVLLDDATYDKGGFFYDRIRDTASNGVATCPRAEHGRQRGLGQPAFHHARVPGYADTMTTLVTEALVSWRDGGEIDAFAVAEMTLALASIATRWTWETTNPTDLSPALSASVIRPRRVSLRLTARTPDGPCLNIKTTGPQFG